MYQVVGFRNVKGVSKSSGREYSGIQIYVSWPMSGVEGMATDRIYLSDAVCRNSQYIPVVGSNVEISYNRFGTVTEVKEV